MNESIRKYWFVEAIQEDGQMHRISGECYDVKVAQKKARYHRNKTGLETSVVEVTETTIVKKAYKVVNKYEPKQHDEEINANACYDCCEST